MEIYENLFQPFSEANFVFDIHQLSLVCIKFNKIVGRLSALLFLWFFITIIDGRYAPTWKNGIHYRVYKSRKKKIINATGGARVFLWKMLLSMIRSFIFEINFV